MTNYLKNFDKNDNRRNNLLRMIGMPSVFRIKNFDNFQHKKKLVTEVKKLIFEKDNLYIYGSFGLGKSHILAAITNLIHDNVEMLTPENAIFTNVPNLLIKIKSTYSKNADENEEELVGRLSTIKYLFLDDLGSENPTEWASTVIFTILENRFNNYFDGVYTYITSNLSPVGLSEKNIDNYSRLSSRLVEHCCRIEIAPSKINKDIIEDYRTIASKERRGNNK
jgi:DNA replication protein DnaC